MNGMKQQYSMKRIIHFILTLLLCYNYNSHYVNCEKLSTGQDVDTYVENMISSADVVVFAKSYCVYCKKTRRILEYILEHDVAGWTYQYIELDKLPDHDGSIIQMELITKTLQSGVPTTFIRGKSYIGYEPIQELYDSGVLAEILYEIVHPPEDEI